MPGDEGTLLQDRRRLLEHVLHVFQEQGGRVQLPIGVTAAEPWLLDTLDVPALLSALSGSGSKAAAVDLLKFCRKGPRTVTADSKAHSRASSRRTTDADGGQLAAAPQLQLPQLETGLSEAELKDLAYLLLACNCLHEGDLLDGVRSQLDVDESRGREVQRLLGLVSSAMREQAGPLPMSKSWTASLELPLCMLGVLLPRDFSRFRAFVTWRDTLAHVLLATLAHSVKDSWCQQQQQQQSPPQPLPQQQQQSLLDMDQQPLWQQQQRPQSAGGGTGQQLMARLKAALRRLDVRDADDFDEQEYRAASAAVRQQAQAIIQCTKAGWAFPWGLRVRLYELLLRALFDDLDEAEYIPDKDRYLQVLEARVRPLLGIPPPMHTAIMAWVHFRQYVLTQSPQLLVETRGLLYQLASITADAAEQQERTPAAAMSSNNCGGGGSSSVESSSSSQRDAAFAKHVGQAVVDWILDRLSDYHCKLEPLGGCDCVAGLVDLLAFASTTRGASDEDIGRALLEAVSLSVSAELTRRLAAGAAAAAAATAADAFEEDGMGASDASRCAALCQAAHSLVAEEQAWTRGFVTQLPEAFPVALSALQEAVGAVLMPWLSRSPVLDEETCQALRHALELEPLLMGPIRAAAGGDCRYACTSRRLASVKPWNMPVQLQPLLSAWLDKQMSGFNVWVDRQLQQEDWKPLGLEQAHASSARELRRIAVESLEALFGLRLPLPPATVRQFMQGIAGMMGRYLDAILNQLGSPAVMIPPTPHLTRYKREVAVKQEEAERQLPGMPTQQPPAAAVSRKGIHFEDSVRRVEEEPCAARVGGLGTPVLVVMMASLAYLTQTLQVLSSTVKQLRQQEQETRFDSSAGGTLFYDRDDPASTAAGGLVAGPPAPNPFLADSDGGMYNSSLANPTAAGYRNSSGAGGGSSGKQGQAWDSNMSPLRQQQQQKQQQQQMPPRGWVDAGWGSGEGGASAGVSSRDEQLGSLHDMGQKLRAGLAAVARWLAVRVVWWEQRAGWCELLYRHRVSSCQIDWLLEGLAGTLQDHASVLPQEPQDLYGLVALELLQQSARALERVLLDGGPCRWFIPADVDTLKDDLEDLRKLFFQAGVPMQDIRTALLGLEGVLRLMARQTGPLIDAHRAARRAALLAGPGQPPSTPPPPSVGPLTATYSAGGYGGYNSPAAAANRGQAQPHGAFTNSNAAQVQQQLGPLAAAKLANASPTAAGAALGDRSGDGRFTHHSRQPTGGSVGSSGFDEAASYSSYASSQQPWPGSLGGAAPAAAAGTAVAALNSGLPPGNSGGGASAGVAGAMGGIGCMRRTAADVAALGGDVETQEPILLRVLCHRADHAASKYLKDNMRVPKVRDETIKETLGRLTRLR